MQFMSGTGCSTTRSMTSCVPGRKFCEILCIFLHLKLSARLCKFGLVFGVVRPPKAFFLNSTFVRFFACKTVKTDLVSKLVQFS